MIITVIRRKISKKTMKRDKEARFNCKSKKVMMLKFTAIWLIDTTLPALLNSTKDTLNSQETKNRWLEILKFVRMTLRSHLNTRYSVNRNPKCSPSMWIDHGWMARMTKNLLRTFLNVQISELVRILVKATLVNLIYLIWHSHRLFPTIKMRPFPSLILLRDHKNVRVRQPVDLQKQKINQITL